MPLALITLASSGTDKLGPTSLKIIKINLREQNTSCTIMETQYHTLSPVKHQQISDYQIPVGLCQYPVLGPEYHHVTKQYAQSNVAKYAC